MNRFRAVFAATLLVACLTTVVALSSPLVSSEFRLTFSGGVPSATSSQVPNITQTSASTTTTTVTQSMTTTTSTNSATTTVTQSTSSTTSTTTTVGAGATSTSTITATVTTVTAANGAYGPVGPLVSQTSLQIARETSFILAPISWILVVGLWVWRGRVRAQWRERGFDSDVFELFMRMKGGATRVRVLSKLSSPKDRLQLAEELGVDWKTVDRQVGILSKYGLVREEAAYGTVRLYEVTPMGKMILNIYEELESKEDAAEKRGAKVEG
jgi:hypothetical protein